MYDRKKIKALSMFLFLFILITGIAYAALPTIDDFNGTAQSITGSSGTPNPTNATVDAASLGGERDFEVIWVSGSDVTLASNSGVPASGSLAFSSATSTQGRGIVTFDGPDGDATALATQGLCSPTCADLTVGGTYSFLRVRVVENDLATTMIFRIYNGTTGLATDYAEYSLALPGGITPGQSVDFLMPFTGFVDSGNGASESVVGALQIFYNQAPATPTTAVDVAIDFFDATSAWDFGDLPAPYFTTLAANGARHRTTTGLRLGNSVDTESDGVPNAAALGDDNALDDEDGVVRQPSVASTNGGWTNGDPGVVGGFNGGALDITITGGSGTPQVFIDFGSGLTEVTLTNILGTPLSMPLSSGTTRVYFSVPAGTFDSVNPISIPVRVRLSSAGGLTASGSANDGEVEDYIFNYGPTAVTLQGTSATSSSSTVIVVVASLFAAALLGVSALSYRKRQI